MLGESCTSRDCLSQEGVMSRSADQRFAINDISADQFDFECSRSRGHGPTPRIREAHAGIDRESINLHHTWFTRSVLQNEYTLQSISENLTQRYRPRPTVTPANFSLLNSGTSSKRPGHVTYTRAREPETQYPDLIPTVTPWTWEKRSPSRNTTFTLPTYLRAREKKD